MERKLQMRESDQVEPIKCPSCKGTMWYEDNNQFLFCDGDGCKHKFGYGPSTDTHVLVWWRYEKGNKYRKNNLKFIEEAMKRIDNGEHLANNLFYRSRGITKLQKRGIQAYCEKKEITRKTFDEIQRIDKQIYSDECVAEKYGLEEGLVTEIRGIEIRG